jgi:hypothetical protein
MRRPQPEEPTEQLTLFKTGRYHYQVLVNLHEAILAVGVRRL